MKDREHSKDKDASDVYRLSPPDIFEALLGDPDEKGYDEETLKKKMRGSKQFMCDSRPVSKEDETG